jgi:hypothetical protein
MIDQMKETLNKQIEEKRKRIDLDKEYHSRFSKEVVDKSVETFKSEQMDNENKNKLVIQKYKEELDRQILAKKQNVLGAMNNTEKDYNKRLLSEILSSPMLVKE